MSNSKQKAKVEELLQKNSGPTHETNYFEDLGLGNFAVFEGVLAPEKSAISRLLARYLFDHRNLYTDANVLELGTGTGILAIIMAKYGAKRVVATDILDVAVNNARENSRRCNLGPTLELRQGDLFDCIRDDESFDRIVFNHPLFFGKPIEGNTISVAILAEGTTIRRFLSKAPKYLRNGGSLIVPFSEIASGDNDPKIHAKEFGLSIKELSVFDTDSRKTFVYELVP